MRGDGVADDSAGLQQAIDKVASSTGAGVLFVPKGTYRLTKTVYVWPGVRLIGYGDSRPVFTLGENTPGFQEGTGKYMLFFSGGRGFGRGGGNGTPADGSAGTFYSAISNIDIEIGPGNPAAVGIRFHVAQHCYLAHMDFRLGSARAGLEDIGNAVEDLHFHGGQYGITTKKSAPGWPILVIDCTFEGQSVAAINDQEGGLTLVRPQFKNVPTAVSIVPGSPEQLWISDGRLENITGPAPGHQQRDPPPGPRSTCKTSPAGRSRSWPASARAARPSPGPGRPMWSSSSPMGCTSRPGRGSADQDRPGQPTR